MTLEEMERNAHQLIKRGETDIAVKQIYDLVLAWAKKKDFAKAEKWRDKIIEINPMALTEILGSDEVIVLEKANTINFFHQKIWENLYTSLSQNEGNAVYEKLKQREFAPGKIIIKQGTINNSLFLVDSGHLKNIFSQNGKDIFLNDLTQGSIAGHDTFFSNSICTSTVVTTSPVTLMFFSRSELQEIENRFPGLSKKLKKFCSRLEAKNYKALLKNKALERRQAERHKLPGKISVQIFDKNKKQIGPTFTGKMDDLSTGGASFFLNGSGKDVGRSLLGRMTTLTIKRELGPELVFKGYILGAKFDQKNTYTINLRFFKPYTKMAIAEIIAKSPPPDLI